MAPIMFQATSDALKGHKRSIDEIDALIARNYPDALKSDAELQGALLGIYNQLAKKKIAVPEVFRIQLTLPSKMAALIEPQQDQAQDSKYTGPDLMNATREATAVQCRIKEDTDNIRLAQDKRMLIDNNYSEELALQDGDSNRVCDKWTGLDTPTNAP